MKKVGILTFHYSNNYGGVLQAYALQSAILRLGNNVEVINYVPKSKGARWIEIFQPSFKRPSKFIRNVFNYNLYKELFISIKYGVSISKKFNSFRKEKIRLTDLISEKDFKMKTKDYDIVIVGSDQVWNPSQRTSNIYFLGDLYKGISKVSYAADSTTSNISKNDYGFLQSRLSEFKHISVRNLHSFEFAKKLTNDKVEIVVDPTLLIDFSDLEENVDEINLPKDYILTYILGGEISGGHKETIQQIKKIYGNIPVLSIKISTESFDLTDEADRYFFDISPQNWLLLFKKAKFIYTDSFHGVLFSLKLSKPFLAYYSEPLRATRFVDLAQRYFLSDFLVTSLEDAKEKNTFVKYPDYKKIHEIINNEKTRSYNYLKDVLGLINE